MTQPTITQEMVDEATRLGFKMQTVTLYSRLPADHRFAHPAGGEKYFSKFHGGALFTVYLTHEAMAMYLRRRARYLAQKEA